jgi:archaellum biogenesis protein FlaJ (TadC family)
MIWTPGGLNGHRSSQGQLVGAGALLIIGVLINAVVLVLLIAGAYSDFVDDHPLWATECIALAAVPFVVASEVHRRINKRSRPMHERIQILSAALITAGLILSMALVFLSAPI